MRWCWLSLLATVLIACQQPVSAPATTSSQKSAEPVGSTASAPSGPAAVPSETAAPAQPQSAAPSAQPQSPAPAADEQASEVRLAVRPLLTVSAPSDPVRLVLHWLHPTPPFVPGAPARGPVVKWNTASFVLEIQGPQGTASYATGRATDARLEGPLAGTASVIGLVGPKAFQVELPPVSNPLVRTQLVDVPWTGAAPNLSRAGRYRISVQATVEIGGSPQRFEAAPITIERVARCKPLSKIEAIGKRAIEAHINQQGFGSYLSKLDHSVRTVDLPTAPHVRLVRYSIPKPPGDKWVLLHYEAVVTPDGKVEQVLEQERYTCVARGTPIATPSGPRPIERLRPGDAVWAYDVQEGRRIMTSVVDVSPPRAAAIQHLAGRLWLTPEHPVLCAGQWVRAGALRAGDEVNLLGEPLRLGPQDRTLRTGYVVDLSVGYPHNFFAAGILVHNKRIAVPAGRFDVWNVLWERALGEYQLIPK